MAIITLSACPATSTRHHRYTSITMSVLDRLGEPEKAEVRNLDDVRAAVQRYGKMLAAAHKDVSFLVSVSVQRGSRKPNGFDAAQSGDQLGTKAWLIVTEAEPSSTALPSQPMADEA